jgi:hypothetical protein
VIGLAGLGAGFATAAASTAEPAGA